MVFQTTFDYPSGTVLFVLFGFAFFQPVFQIVDADAAFFKTGVAEQIAVQRGIGFDAGHGKLGEGDAHFCHCLLTGFADDADFADQAVVVRRDAVALVNMAVHADTEAAGQVAAFNQAWAGDEVVRVFGIDAALESMAFDVDVFLLVLQRQAAGNADLFLYDVHAGNQLGNGVFDLDAGVHFDKEEFAVLIQEFKRTCATVADTFAGVGTGFADFFAGFFVDEGSGVLLR